MITPNGSGTGRVLFSVAANTSGGPRTGTIQVAGQTVTVKQGYDCTFTLSSVSVSIDARGKGGTATSPSSKVEPSPYFNITASKSGCPWSATTSAGWITLVTPSGSGTGKVEFNVAANTSGGPRTGTIQVAGQTVTVKQGYVACAITLSASSTRFESKGGSGSITVSTDPSCNWSARSTADWIRVSSKTTQGKGVVQFAVSINQGSDRTGSIMIADKTITIAQKGSEAPKQDSKKSGTKGSVKQK
jgi:hypothetical protein